MVFNFFKKKFGKNQKETEVDTGPDPAVEVEADTATPKVETASDSEDCLQEALPTEIADPVEEIIEELVEKTVEEEPVKEAVQEIPDTERETDDTGLFFKLKKGLSKTRKVLNTDISDLFSGATAIDEDLFEELEELLVTSDLGIDITMELMERIRTKAKKLETGEQLKAVLKEELLLLFSTGTEPEASRSQKPHVIMMVGVNGTGKTTTLGKLAMRYTQEGKKVLIAAADTFRAAAIEQVEIWAERANAGIVRHKEGADPAAVAYDAVEAAMARNVDVVLIDTAGRLHTQKNLMEELKKIKRSVDKKFPGAPHEVMMVIDATTGQNAISQAKIFNKAVGLTRISITKLDGTAKGGIVAAVSSIMNLPIGYIGVGEAIEDLQDFDAQRFVDALFD